MHRVILIEVINMTRKEEITKKLEELELGLYRADLNYNHYTNLVYKYLEKKRNLNEQINDLKEELQELESENLIAPLNSAIATLKNYCGFQTNCRNCLLNSNCEENVSHWNKLK